MACRELITITGYLTTSAKACIAFATTIQELNNQSPLPDSNWGLWFRRPLLLSTELRGEIKSPIFTD